MIEPFHWPIPAPDALVFILQCQKEDAAYCDLVKFRQQEGMVDSLSFISPDETPTDSKININSGIIYLKSTIFANLLSLTSKYPLDRCTYLGEDNGTEILQVKLNIQQLTACDLMRSLPES